MARLFCVCFCTMWLGTKCEHAMAVIVLFVPLSFSGGLALSVVGWCACVWLCCVFAGCLGPVVVVVVCRVGSVGCGFVVCLSTAAA